LCLLLQEKKQKSLEILRNRESFDFFLPYLSEEYHINFYGGEPLLCYSLIEKTVSFLNKKNKEIKKRANYSITTNGSLITREIIHYFNENKFSVELSFDGLAQDVQRKKGSFEKIVSGISEILNYSNIDLEINSVFTPENIEYLSESIRFLVDLGVPNIHFTLSFLYPWDRNSLQKLEKQIIQLRKILLLNYKGSGNIPVINFREDYGKGIFYCAAGKDRLAITPEGEIWGCFLFPDYFKGKENSPEYLKFYFGTLDDFVKNHKDIYPRISTNYAQLSMNNFYTSNMRCFLCSELENCAVCPINASFSGNPLGKIPSYVCEIQKIKIKEKETFMEELLNIR